MNEIYDKFDSSTTEDLSEFNHEAIPEPDTLSIRMTRGEHRIADELRKQFGGFKRVIIDVDGERHDFGADSLIQMLKGYENESCWYELFGTPEKAARTLVYVLGCNDSRPWVSCEECPILNGCKIRSGGYDALFKWLREDM